MRIHTFEVWSDSVKGVHEAWAKDNGSSLLVNKVKERTKSVRRKLDRYISKLQKGHK